MEINEKLEEIKAENKANTEYLLYESAVARLERANKRLWITNIIKDIILVIVVCGFLVYLNQYDFMSCDYNYDYTQDSNGVNIIGNKNGVDYNNVTETTSENTEENEDKEVRNS